MVKAFKQALELLLFQRIDPTETIEAGEIAVGRT